MLLSLAFGLSAMNSKEVEDLKGQYRSLKEAEGSLSRAQKTRLNRLHEALSDIPDWTRETEHDRRQTELLTKIQETIERNTTGSNGRSGRRQGRV